MDPDLKKNHELCRHTVLSFPLDLISEHKNSISPITLGMAIICQRLQSWRPCTASADQLDLAIIHLAA